MLRTLEPSSFNLESSPKMRKGSMKMLIDVCAKEPHGLIGLFQGGEGAVKLQALEDFATSQENSTSIEDFGVKRGADPGKLLGNGDSGSGNEKGKALLTPPISGRKRTATLTIGEPSKRRR